MEEHRRTYREKLLDPRWQRVRLRVFARDDWSCVACGETTRTLHVHHLRYEASKEPWEAHPDTLATLCELCHSLISPAALSTLMAKLSMSKEELWEAASRVEDKLMAWLNQRQKAVEAACTIPPTKTFVSSCPDWRELRPRAGRVWTPDEDEALLLEYEAGLPLEQIALLRGRGVFGVAVRLCKLGRIPPDPGSI
jgi:5-methylcytosine-specific restriction endonuclease McrA